VAFQRKLISVSRSSTFQAQISERAEVGESTKTTLSDSLIRSPRPRFQPSPRRTCHGAVDDGTQTASIERCIQLIGTVRGHHTRSLCAGKNRGNSRVISTIQIDDYRLREDAAGCWH
jgi:hypothetical protein